jgi:hypothetical protein
MGRPSKSNVPAAALRWSVERAGIEFGLTSQTLRKALNKNSATADADGLYTTQQVAAAIYGSMHIEKLATQKELRRKLEFENAVTEARLIDRAELMKGLAMVADAMSSRIMTSELSRSSKQDLLKELASVPLVLKDVAHAQSRLPRRGKGKRNGDGEDDGSED